MKMIDGCSDVRCGFFVTTTDGLFVGFTIFLDLCTWLYLFVRELDWAEHRRLPHPIMFTMLAVISSVGCNVGKLYPARYSCRSLACAKVSHNAIMTLLNFPFDVVATVKMTAAADMDESYFELISIFIFILMNSAYLLYDVGKYWDFIDSSFLRFVTFWALVFEVLVVLYELMRWFSRANQMVVPEGTDEKIWTRLCDSRAPKCCSCICCVLILVVLILGATRDDEGD